MVSGDSNLPENAPEGVGILWGSCKLYSLTERQDLHYVVTEVTCMLRDVLGVRDLFSEKLYYNSEFA